MVERVTGLVAALCSGMFAATLLFATIGGSAQLRDIAARAEAAAVEVGPIPVPWPAPTPEPLTLAEADSDLRRMVELSLSAAVGPVVGADGLPVDVGLMIPETSACGETGTRLSMTLSVRTDDSAGSLERILAAWTAEGYASDRAMARFLAKQLHRARRVGASAHAGAKLRAPCALMRGRKGTRQLTVTEDPTDTPRSGIRRAVTQNPLAAYFVVAFGFSWLIEVPVALSAQGVVAPLPQPVVAVAIIAATFGPAASAFTVTALVEGRVGVIALLRCLVQWRVSALWYLFVLLGVPAAVLLGAILVPGALPWFDPTAFAALSAYPLAFVRTLLLGGPLGEEPGWRGFALPRLQSKHGPLRASLILGVVWAAWHLPLFWSGVWTPPTAANMLMFAVMIVALTIIMTWVFNHAHGSLWIMILMHASFNTFANRVAAPLFPAPVFEEYGLLPVLIGFSLTAIILIIATRGRLGAGTASARET